MNYARITWVLLLIVPSVMATSVPGDSEKDLQAYLTEMEAEVSKYLNEVQKAGNNHSEIAAASKAHVEAMREISRKHRVGLQNYYKAFEPSEAERKPWQLALAELKKEYESKLGKYWEEQIRIYDVFNHQLKELRARYSKPLKEYQGALSELNKKYFPRFK